MKSILFAVMLSLSSLSHAYQVQKEKPVMCYELKEFMNHLMEKYNEKLQFSFPNGMYDGSTQIAMYTNKETGTWTIFEYNEEMACLLAVGKTNFL